MAKLMKQKICYFTIKLGKLSTYRNTWYSYHNTVMPYGGATIIFYTSVFVIDERSFGGPHVN